MGQDPLLRICRCDFSDTQATTRWLGILDGGNLGVAFFSSRVVFEDGTEWKPRHLGERFHVYWRDRDHPDLPVLPLFRFKQKED